MFFFFKLINKLQKNGNKYKFYIYYINLLYYIIYIYKYTKVDIKKIHFLEFLNIELKLNLYIFTKKKKYNKDVIIFLKTNKRLKEFMKIFYILLQKQKFRKLIFRLYFLTLEFIFFFDTNIYSIIKNSFSSTMSKKKKIKKNTKNYLGNLELLNMFNIILSFLISLVIILIIKKFIFIKVLFLKFLNYCIYLKKMIIDNLFIYFFNYNLQKKKQNLLYKPLKINDMFIFFQFGSKKHVYFKSWFNNLKRRKYWIWKWRN